MGDSSVGGSDYQADAGIDCMQLLGFIATVPTYRLAKEVFDYAFPQEVQVSGGAADKMGVQGRFYLVDHESGTFRNHEASLTWLQDDDEVTMTVSKDGRPHFANSGSCPRYCMRDDMTVYTKLTAPIDIQTIAENADPGVVKMRKRYGRVDEDLLLLRDIYVQKRDFLEEQMSRGIDPLAKDKRFSREENQDREWMEFYEIYNEEMKAEIQRLDKELEAMRNEGLEFYGELYPGRLKQKGEGMPPEPHELDLNTQPWLFLGRGDWLDAHLIQNTGPPMSPDGLHRDLRPEDVSDFWRIIRKLTLDVRMDLQRRREMVAVGHALLNRVKMMVRRRRKGMHFYNLQKEQIAWQEARLEEKAKQATSLLESDVDDGDGDLDTVIFTVKGATPLC
mmetsp:Transcript_65598/g.128995  ORF Transcript_65598/g.128995 Transcript_65598/m.128995 type:complete len:391 (+) Transcript_65598:2-1174(+)